MNNLKEFKEAQVCSKCGSKNIVMCGGSLGGEDAYMEVRCKDCEHIEEC